MKRLIFILAISLIGIWASFLDAFYGLLLHTWYTFGSPLELSFGKLSGSRLSLVVGAVVIIFTIQQHQRIFIRSAMTTLSIVFVASCFASLAISMKYDLISSIQITELIGKIVLMALVAPVILDSPQKIRVYIIVMTASSALLGAYYGTFGLIHGSREIVGPGKVGDNNGYAVWLTSTLPFIYLLGCRIPGLSARIFLWLLFLGNLLAIMLTFSRGGMIAALSVMFFLLLQNKRIAIFVLIAVLLSFGIGSLFESGEDLQGSDSLRLRRPSVGQLVQDTWAGYQKRIQTLRQAPEEIESAASRLHFWKVAVRMFADHPISGIGLNQYQERYDDYDFLDGKYGRSRSVHNTFLAILAETGLFGSLIFVLVFFSAFVEQSRIKRIVKTFADSRIKSDILACISALRISFVGFFVGGFFVMCLYQETLWVFVTLTIALKELVEKIDKEEGMKGLA